MSDDKNYPEILKTAFDKVLMNKYGTSVPPSPLITSFGIKPLDCLLGGGLTSSAPIIFSSTPETGKSTLALQFSAIFQKTYPNSICVYLNVEEAAGDIKPNTESVHQMGIDDRISTFNIDPKRFLHKPILLDVKEMFELINDLIQIKPQMEQRTGQAYQVLFILDSIAAVCSSKDSSAADPNEVIGFKARELTFNLAKYKKVISMNQISFIMIDQVRSNITQAMSTPWQKAAAEKSVGSFGNFQAATNINSLNHNVRQWLWLSKGEVLKPTDPMGVDGWIINVFTEKNKLAPSKYSIPIVFDKKYGVVPFLSEYLFLSNKTKTENKYWPKEKKLPYPLSIATSGNSRVLEVLDPSTGTILYRSEPFMERNAIQKYNSDINFRQWFDKAIDIAVEQRININLFRSSPIILNHESDVISDIEIDNDVDNVEPEEVVFSPDEQDYNETM
jgi:RecA/RadA recombinase